MNNLQANSESKSGDDDGPITDDRYRESRVDISGTKKQKLNHSEIINETALGDLTADQNLKGFDSIKDADLEDGLIGRKPKTALT